MGFDTNLFANPVDEDHVCVICSCVLERPTTVCREGHVFCAGCIDDWDLRSNTCPTCRQTTMTNRILCRPVQNQIMALQACCPEKVEVEQEESGLLSRASKRARGNDGTSVATTTCTVRACGWQGTLANYLERHNNGECQFRNIKCPLECGEAMRAFHLEEHLVSECKSRKVMSKRLQQGNPACAQGEYDVCILTTAHGLMLRVGKLNDGSIAFRGYRRGANGEKGHAENNKLIRNVGDKIVAVNGTAIHSYEHAIGLILQSTRASYSTVLRFREKMNF